MTLIYWLTANKTDSRNIRWAVSIHLKVRSQEMPQPISRVSPNATIIIGNAGDRPLMRHPQLAVLAIEAIASWSNVESFMLNLFVQLLGGNGSLAAEIFLSLENQSAKTSAVNAAAECVLENEPENLALLKAILSISKTNEKSRNKLAHWLWGDSPDLQDALLLVNPKTKMDSIDRSEVYVYREQDFLSIIQANDRLCGFGLRLSFILCGHVANRDGRLFDELMAEPEIRERLGRNASEGS